ncbi:MAG: hypothetical protein ACREH7_03805 [Candidatus Rokuibacteriota bacterium]
MGEHDPWKATMIALMLMFGTMLVSALVMANWAANDKPGVPRAVSGKGARPAATPTAADIEICNARAKTQVGSAPTELLKDAVIGGAVGATAGTLYGLNEANKSDVRYQEAYRQCMRGRGYVG